MDIHQHPLTIRDHVQFDSSLKVKIANELTDLFGRGRRVAVVRRNDGSERFQFAEKKPQNWKKTALKLAAWVLSGGILPLLALGVVAYSRWTHRDRIKEIQSNTAMAMPSPTQSKPHPIHPDIARLNAGVCTVDRLGYNTFEAAFEFLLEHKEDVQRIDFGYRAHVPGGFSTFIKPEHIQKLKVFNNLRAIELNDQDVDPKIMQEIVQLKQLEELNLLDIHSFSLECFSLLPLLPHLKKLKLSGPYYSQFGMQKLAQVKSLESLTLLKMKSCNTSALKHIKNLRSLRTLKLQGAENVDPDVFQHFKTLKNLRELHLNDFNGTVHSLGWLTYLPDLERLNIVDYFDLNKLYYNSKYKQDLLYQYLSNCTALHQLNCKWSSLSELLKKDELWEKLPDLRLGVVLEPFYVGPYETLKAVKDKVVALKFQNFELYYPDIENLALFPHLEKLEIINCFIGEDHAFEPILAIKSLKRLHLVFPDAEYDELAKTKVYGLQADSKVKVTVEGF